MMIDVKDCLYGNFPRYKVGDVLISDLGTICRITNIGKWYQGFEYSFISLTYGNPNGILPESSLYTFKEFVKFKENDDANTKSVWNKAHGNT